MDSIKILRIRYNNIKLYKNGQFDLNLMATDRVVDFSQVFQIRNSVYSQKMAAIIGINAAGKTSSLKLIYLAMSLILDNASLNTEIFYGRELLKDGSEIRITFAYKDICYELCSIIGKKKDSYSNRVKLYFKEEYLYSKKLSTIKIKKDTFLFENIPGVSVMKRSKMSESVLSVLQDDDSMVIIVTKNNTTSLRRFMSFTDMNMVMLPGSIPLEVIRVFDSNLEELTTEEKTNGRTYKVRFKNQKDARVVSSPSVLNALISSGTIKGQNIVALMKDILSNGGYLIVDELENHMNKEILYAIINIFKSERINKHGACLLFSTNYAEILDFMDRKDNIYIVRKENSAANNIEIMNYAHEIKRNDLKKSEIILSNQISGTVPPSENLQALADYLSS